MGVRVKPLHWVCDTYKNAWPQRYRALTPFGDYSVCGSDGKDNWVWYRNGYSCGADSLTHRSQQGAMAAAFDHYAETIMACLEDAPP